MFKFLSVIEVDKLSNSELIEVNNKAIAQIALLNEQEPNDAKLASITMYHKQLTAISHSRGII